MSCNYCNNVLLSFLSYYSINTYTSASGFYIFYMYQTGLFVLILGYCQSICAGLYCSCCCFYESWAIFWLVIFICLVYPVLSLTLFQFTLGIHPIFIYYYLSFIINPYSIYYIINIMIYQLSLPIQQLYLLNLSESRACIQSICSPSPHEYTTQSNYH